jgi:hypothetical protein
MGTLTVSGVILAVSERHFKFEATIQPRSCVMEKETKLHIGEGILKPGVRPIKVYVDAKGEYWICDKDVDPESEDFKKDGCVAHSEIHMVK